jgi:hypothetical protein
VGKTVALFFCDKFFSTVTADLIKMEILIRRSQKIKEDHAQVLGERKPVESPSMQF